MPMYRCRSNDSDEWTLVNAFDAESAACEFAECEDMNSAEYPDEQSVTINTHGVFTVTGEVTRSYGATKINPHP